MATRSYQTVTVPTNTLKVGDIILAHGGLFRVKHVHVSQSHDNTGPGGEVHANYCEFIDNAFEWECSIPKSWRSGAPAQPGRGEWDNFWNQQGNGLAQTCLVRSMRIVSAPAKHAYAIETDGLDLTVEATNRTQAASRARKAGFPVHSVNMIG